MPDLKSLLTQNQYVKDIIGESSAIRNSIDIWTQTDQLAVIGKRIRSFDYKKILLTGMGSSFYTLYPLYLRLLQNGIPVYHIETSELIHYSTNLISDDCLTIIVSQSGESIEMQRLLMENHERGLTIGITNTEQSTLSKNADCVFLTHAGIEKSVSCKTYMTGLSAIALLGDILCDESTSDTIGYINKAIGGIEDYLANTESYINKLIDLFSDVKYLIVTGRGASLASAYLSGLIIKEASHFFAEGMSSAAFRHGPFEVVSPDLFLIVFSGNPTTSKLNEELVKEVLLSGGKAALVKKGKQCDPFIVPDVPCSILPMVEMLPIQMVSITLSILHGHEPGKFKFVSKVTLDE